MTEITPARLRELAEAHELLRPRENSMAMDTAAALRAAADQQERDAQKYARLEEANLALLADHAEALATLAARDALLAKARAASGAVVTAHEQRELDLDVAAYAALAAEIAAALGAGIPPHTDDQENSNG